MNTFFPLDKHFANLKSIEINVKKGRFDDDDQNSPLMAMGNVKTLESFTLTGYNVRASHLDHLLRDANSIRHLTLCNLHIESNQKSLSSMSLSMVSPVNEDDDDDEQSKELHMNNTMETIRLINVDGFGKCRYIRFGKSLKHWEIQPEFTYRLDEVVNLRWVLLNQVPKSTKVRLSLNIHRLDSLSLDTLFNQSFDIDIIGLHLLGGNLTLESLPSIMFKFPNITELEVLIGKDMPIQEYAAKGLLEFIDQHPKLKSLSINGNDRPNQDVYYQFFKDLFGRIGGLQELTSLSLINMPLYSTADEYRTRIPIIVEAIRTRPTTLVSIQLELSLPRVVDVDQPPSPTSMLFIANRDKWRKCDLHDYPIDEYYLKTLKP
ncbi:hypothetical protein SAMD00019534_006050 [Acytostelium subglobosum LB1]|uniref:hypothetical protein n=1 Tax=Acytostelium subglobosum LB1 TaxID=1410327 RepID=UPI00064496C4|nr:hypothetical protein SAMD00019534_006050 [Acytostelium subglobosum LB1]GAM17430.1 hypothetical protein SAMD00019534_006050 [Acytostelium subglobosum LB1]|eukprot:XP_012759492.1 hypothetical protein SAMD00019534_006050 [Acytostelium subglobosum LB1]